MFPLLRVLRSAWKKLLDHIVPSAFHNSAERYNPPRCHPQTRTAILREIMDWARNPQNLRLLMWIYGPAGAGKSAIMQTIAELCQEAGILGGSFFFFRTGDKRNIKTYLIPTIAYQLAVKYPGFYNDITLAILRNPTVFSQNLEAQTKALIVQPMIAFLDLNLHVCGSPIIILVDGLDECCPEDSHREIITALSGLAFLPFRVIIGSRPEYIIRNTFFTPIHD